MELEAVHGGETWHMVDGAEAPAESGCIGASAAWPNVELGVLCVNVLHPIKRYLHDREHCSYPLPVT